MSACKRNRCPERAVYSATSCGENEGGEGVRGKREFDCSGAAYTNAGAVGESTGVCNEEPSVSVVLIVSENDSSSSTKGDEVIEKDVSADMTSRGGDMRSRSKSPPPASWIRRTICCSVCESKLRAIHAWYLPGAIFPAKYVITYLRQISTSADRARSRRNVAGNNGGVRRSTPRCGVDTISIVACPKPKMSCCDSELNGLEINGGC